MSMMQQPRTPSPPSSPPKRSWLTTEWDHLDTMPLSTMGLLSVPTVLLGILNPLLPPVAYAMQRWAGASWTWRDRWASVRTWAKQGAWIVAILLLIAWLAAVHVLFFPALVMGVQNAWHTAHLPDTLSLALTPLNRYALVTRILLSLPLAPALSLYYERIDPRTPMQPQRVLTPADLAALTQPPPVAPPASAHTATQDQATTPPKPMHPKAASTKRRHKDTTATRSEQMTIDSVLAPQQEASSTSTPASTAPSTPQQETGKKKGTRRTTTGQSVTQDLPPSPVTQDAPATQSGLIYIPDWDDVAE